MGFCSCVNKLFLAVLNFAILAVGVAVIGLASLVIHRSSKYTALLLDDGIVTLPIWILIVGIAVTLLGFFGCCGALKENSCMLYTYATIVTALFIAEIVLGVLIALYPNKAHDHIKTSVKGAFNKYNQKDDSLDRAIDSLQHDLGCCGAITPNDWYDTTYGKIPRSCCVDPADCDPSNTDQIFVEGCYSAIINDLKPATLALGITAIVLAAIQVVCICIACGLAQKRSQYV